MQPICKMERSPCMRDLTNLEECKQTLKEKKSFADVKSSVVFGMLTKDIYLSDKPLPQCCRE